MASRVAFIDDNASERMLWSSLLSVSHYEVGTADGDGAEDFVRDTPPDIVLMGPGAGAPLAVVDRLTRTLSQAPRPMVILTSAPDAEDRLAAFDAGACDVLPASIRHDHLLARMRSILRGTETFRELRRRRLAALRFGFAEDRTGFARPKRVVAIGGDGLPAAPGLRAFAVERRDLRDVLARDADALTADGFVLDWTGTTSGDAERHALPELRARPHTRHSGILVLYDADDESAAIQALDNGASDAVAAGVAAGEYALRLTRMLERKAAEDELRQRAETSAELAVTDPLTGVFNRRYAEAYLADIVAGGTDARPFALMMADIDRFKAINDTYGHTAGDRVLKAVAERLRRDLRSVDLIARYGGEEFLIVLADSSVDEARRAAHRLKRRIGQTPVDLGDGREVDVTVSLGVSMGDAAAVARIRRQAGAPGARAVSGPDWSGMIDRADKALYRAKALGRNRVQMAE